jgi:cohesin complex subunit SA-1/2
MDLLHPDPPADSPNAAPSRRSGRVSRRPELLADQIADASTSGKRKRAPGEDIGDGDDALDDDEDDDDVPSDDPNDGDASDGAAKSRRRRTKSGAAPRRSAKKPRQNGDAVSLAVRPANAQKPTKARRKKAARFTDAANASGLYCMWRTAVCLC